MFECKLVFRPCKAILLSQTLDAFISLLCIPLIVANRKNVKRWALDLGFDWFGPGVHSDKKYDYVIVLGKGMKAMFSSSNKSLVPTEHAASNSTFYIFPSLSFVFGKKELSKTQFLSGLEWVQSCFENSPSEFKSFLSNSSRN